MRGEEQLTGGVPITSGGFDHFTPSAVDQPSYEAGRMVDADLFLWPNGCGVRSLLVVRPGAPSSVLAPGSDALCS